MSTAPREAMFLFLPTQEVMMKRSEINILIENAIAFFQERKFYLPPFAYYTCEDWLKRQDDVREVFDLGLGWDITDFGSNDFSKIGLLLFTIRNGKLGSAVYPKSYAEKIMLVQEEQVTPMHFHWNKMEDIINRGGGNLVIELYNATQDDKLANTDIVVAIDGFRTKVKADGKVILKPGESICLTPRLYHRFYGEKGKGAVMVGEVSMVNDDANDNCFYEPVGRFPAIVEDVPAKYLLCNEYAKHL